MTDPNLSVKITYHLFEGAEESNRETMSRKKLIEEIESIKKKFSVYSGLTYHLDGSITGKISLLKHSKWPTSCIAVSINSERRLS